MARKEQKIKTVSYVSVGGVMTNTDDLTEEQKRELGTWIRCTILNAVYGDIAHFRPAREGEKGF